MNTLFEWDEQKARQNSRKHGVNFDEAQTVFDDLHSMTIPDPDHSIAEDRWIDIGLSSKKRNEYWWWSIPNVVRKFV